MNTIIGNKWNVRSIHTKSLWLSFNRNASRKVRKADNATVTVCNTSTWHSSVVYSSATSFPFCCVENVHLHKFTYCYSPGRLPSPRRTRSKKLIPIEEEIWFVDTRGRIGNELNNSAVSFCFLRPSFKTVE